MHRGFYLPVRPFSKFLPLLLNVSRWNLRKFGLHHHNQHRLRTLLSRIGVYWRNFRNLHALHWRRSVF